MAISKVHVREQRPVVEKAPDGAAPLLPAIGFGTALGALAAAASLAIEMSVAAAVGAPVVARADFGLMVELTVVLGAVLGACSGLTGAVGGRAVFAWACLWTGFYLGSAGATWYFDAGTSPWLGLLLGVIIGVSAAGLQHLLVGNRAIALAAGIGLIVGVSVLAPLQAYVVPSMTDPVAFGMDLLVVALSVLLGVLVWLFGRPGTAAHAAAALTLVLLLAAAPLSTRFDAKGAWPVAEGDAHPPILLIVVEGLRADRVGTLGGPSTPAIDAAARRGVVYTDASATAPWTTPSFATLLTGRLPGSHGAGMNAGSGAAPTAIRSNVPTVPELLSAKGTVSAAILSSRLTLPALGFDRGVAAVDYSDGDIVAPIVLRAFVLARFAPFDRPPIRPGREVTDHALAFIAAQSHSQWMLTVDYNDLLATDATTYDAGVAAIDAEIGRLLAGIDAGATIVIAGSHGRELLENRPYANALPAGFRDGHSLYQEQLHVPLIVVGGRAGVRATRPVSLLDVAPTLLQLADAPPVPVQEGMFLAEVSGGTGPRDRTIVAEALRWGPEARMARKLSMKLIDAADRARLYDLGSDGNETTPLTGTTDEDALARGSLTTSLPMYGGDHTDAPRWLSWRDVSARLGRARQAP